MRRSIFYIIFIQFVVLFSCTNKSASNEISNSFLNLSFEETSGNSNVPVRWFLGEIGYKIERIKEKENNKYSMKIISNNPKDGEFGMVLNYLPINIVKGKKVLYCGRVKTEDVIDGYAGLWCGVNQSYGPLSFEDWHKTGIDKTTNWQNVSTEIFVDENANEFNFGLILNGKGTAWFDDLEIFIDGNKYLDIKARELSNDEISWLTNNIHPIKSYKLSEPLNDDLEIFDEILGGANVIALGEVTHGASEIHQLKSRIIKYLIEHQNYNTFSIEANMPESYKINEYIINGQGNPENYLKGLYFWTWNTKEVLNLVEWMKDYNSSNKKILFTGFDMQMYMGAITTLKDSLVQNKAAIRLVDQLDLRLKNNMQRMMETQSSHISSSDTQKITEITDQIRKQIDASTIKDKIWLEQNIKIIEQSVKDQDDIKREQAMADNFLWIKQQNSDSKSIIWGHNMHVSKAEPWMGSILSNKLGNNYLNVGFAFYEGSYNAIGEDGLKAYPAQAAYLGTYEYYFNQVANCDMFLLDLRALKNDNSNYSQWLKSSLRFRTTGGMKIEEEFSETNLLNDYDLIIFIKKVTPTELLPR